MKAQRKLAQQKDQKKNAKLIEIQKELIAIKKHNDSHKIYFQLQIKQFNKEFKNMRKTIVEMKDKPSEIDYIKDRILMSEQ